MQIGDDQGQLLTMLTRLVGARRAVEVGTFTGYSSMCIARGLAEGGSLLCCDVSAEWTEIGRRSWAAAGLDDRIELRVAPALDTLRALPEVADIDLAFIDADKPGYAAYWATLTLTDVRRGLDQVRDQLAGFVHDDRTFWHAPGDPPARAGAPRGHLLQILDEVYRGYQDSRMVLDSSAIVPGGRETAIGMALVDGQMVARMKRTIGRRVTFEITPYADSLTPSQRTSVEQAAARYADFLGLEHELRA